MEPQVAESIRDARDTVMKQRESADAWGRLGIVFHAHGLKEEAADCYTRTIELSPEEFKWSYLLATVLQAVDLEGALVQAERASRLNPAYAPTHLLIGQLLEQMSRPQAALEAYRKAVSADPTLTAAGFALGRLHLARRDLEASQRLLERAARQQPKARSIHAFLARVYRLQNKEAEASRAAVTARRVVADVAVRDPVLGEMLDAAVSTAQYSSRALQAEAAGDYQNAESLYRRAIEIRPTDATLRYNFGNVLLLQGRSPEAEEQYRMTLELQPGDVKCRVNLGSALAIQDRFEEAMQEYRKALELDPTQADALVNLTALLLATGEVPQAARLYEKALERDPHQFDALLGLGRILASRQETGRAVGYFQRALEVRREDGSLHYELAVALAAERDFDDAWRHTHQARRLGVGVPEGFLAALREAMPEPEEASPP